MTRYKTLVRDDNCPNYGKALHIGAGLTVATVNGCPTISVDETANLGLVAGQLAFGSATGGIAQDADLSFSTVTNQLSLGVGTVGAPSYTFVGQTTDGFYSVSATQIGTAINGVLVGGWNSTGLFTNVISEQTAAAGVTVDGALLKDGGIVVVAGTAATPSVTTVGDLDTGLYFPAAGFVALSANGTTAVQASSSDVTFTGAVRINNFLAFVGASQNLTTTGVSSAVNVTTANTDITLTTAADLATLAAGSQDGQLKIITIVAEGAVGNGLVLTPATPLGFTTITFTAAGTNVGDTVMMEYKNATWRVLSARGNVVVA